MKNIAYIIGHRSADKYRLKNLLIVIDRLIQIKHKCLEYDITLSIIIIEQDKTPTIKDGEILHSQVHYVFIYNDGYYNRGWGFNVGFRLFSSYDYFYFADNDIIINERDLIHAFEHCFKYDAVNPYNVIYNTLESTETECFRQDSFNIKELKQQKKVEQDERPYICFSGGIVGISRKSMYLISGWDERFRGRGWEDYAFTSKLFLFLSRIHTFSLKALHLWHPWETNTTRCINEKLNQEYGQYKVDNYIDMIEETRHIFGSCIKYSHINLPSDRFCNHYYIDDFKQCYKDQCDKAITKYEKLLELVKRKHSSYHLNFHKRLVYYNLCEQHICRDHRSDEDIIDPLIFESGDKKY
jgi:hypothetical protein